MRDKKSVEFEFRSQVCRMTQVATSKLTFVRRRAPDETAGGGACARPGERAFCGDGGMDESGDEASDDDDNGVDANDDEIDAPVDGCAEGSMGGTVSALSSLLADAASVLTLRALLPVAPLAVDTLSVRVTIGSGRDLMGTG